MSYWRIFRFTHRRMFNGHFLFFTTFLAQTHSHVKIEIKRNIKLLLAIRPPLYIFLCMIRVRINLFHQNTIGKCNYTTT